VAGPTRRELPVNLNSIHRVINKVVKRRWRRRRMAEFVSRFGVTSESQVLDVGGRPGIWSLLAAPPRVFLLNPDTSVIDVRRRPRMHTVIGDGRRLPFRDGAFDVVFSNAAIEHVGSPDKQRLFADECRRVGRRYWVQTPVRSFPVEPHLMTPFVHWLPRRWEMKLLRNFTVWGWMTRPTAEQCRSFVDEVYLLSLEQMRNLFPDAKIVRERLLGLTKSVIAMKAREDRVLTAATSEKGASG
jgi:hypothetical protein